MVQQTRKHLYAIASAARTRALQSLLQPIHSAQSQGPGPQPAHARFTRCMVSSTCSCWSSRAAIWACISDCCSCSRFSNVASSVCMACMCSLSSSTSLSRIVSYTHSIGIATLAEYTNSGLQCTYSRYVYFVQYTEISCRGGEGSVRAGRPHASSKGTKEVPKRSRNSVDSHS